jgi:hypothetical protein
MLSEKSGIERILIFLKRKNQGKKSEINIENQTLKHS